MNKKDFKVSIFKTLNGKQPTDISWDEIVNLLRGDSFKLATNNYRLLVSQRDEAEATGNVKGVEYATSAMRKAKLSCQGFVPSVFVSGGRAKANITGYTGAIMVDIDHVAQDKLADILARITADPHTFIAYTTISGRGLRIIAFVDGKVTAKNFSDAWFTINDYYAQLAGVEVDVQCKNATRMCGLCHDPNVFFNPEAIALKETISADKAETVVRRLVEDNGVYYRSGEHNAYVSQCLYWMNRLGVDEWDARQWALRVFADYDAREHSVAATVKSCYQNVSEHGTYRIRNVECGMLNGSPRRGDYELTNSKLNNSTSGKARLIQKSKY